MFQLPSLLLCLARCINSGHSQRRLLEWKGHRFALKFSKTYCFIWNKGPLLTMSFLTFHNLGLFTSLISPSSTFPMPIYVPATWASYVPQRCPSQGLCIYWSWGLKHYSLVLCMAAFILNFTPQLRCHLFSQISKVPTILLNSATLLHHLVFSFPSLYHCL